MTRGDHPSDGSTADAPNQRDSSAVDDSTHSYLCPYCTEAEYPTETLVRVHISYATDSSHESQDGMIPEVEPVELDASGQQVGTAFTLPAKLNLHGLSLEDIPVSYDGREFDERERRALLVAAFNANRDLSGTELQDRVTAHLAERDLDPLSARAIRQLCRHVFLPHIDAENAGCPDETPADGTGITTAETALRDLTALQQAIILAHLARPDIDRTTLATRIGTANSYPTQVIDARANLVARLRSRIEGGTTLERLVAERIPVEDLERLVSERYLEEFDIDLQAVRERKRPRPRSNGVPGTVPVDSSGTLPTSEGDDGASEGECDRTGSDRSDSHGRDGAITDGACGDNKAGTEETETNNGVTGEVAADGIDSNDATPATSDSDATVPRAEVEAVREQVAFDLAVVEQEMELTDPTPQQVRTKAYLEQILDRLDEIL